LASRYREKRKTPISIEELSSLMRLVEVVPESSSIDELTRTSLVAGLFYTGLRVGEVVGDSNRKWKALTPQGIQLSRTQGGLPKSWMNTPEGELWAWRNRGYLPGLIKEDIHREGEILYIDSVALKHGRRENPLELILNWPYVDLIEAQWIRTMANKRVWPISQSSVRIILRKASDILYPHAFRGSLASSMARDPTISVSDMMGWFGWARASTADAYIMAQRSVVTARQSIGRMVKSIPPPGYSQSTR